MEYAFNLFNKAATPGIVLTLHKFLKEQDAPPVLLCIGSDLAIGDSLGPVAGTMLQSSAKQAGTFVYGTLQRPVTAKEVRCLADFLKETHPHAKIIAIDAAVGEEGDIGLIKIGDRGIRPGSGANKKFAPIGDVGILGIVAEKSLFNYSLLNLTRLSLVYKMATAISDAVSLYLTGTTHQALSAV